MKLAASVFTSACLALCVCAWADDSSPARQDPATPVEVPIPESPAAAALGNAGTILRPSTAQEFAVSLNNAVDRGGKLRPNVSLEVSPYLMANRGRPIHGYADGVDIERSKAAGRTVLKSFPLSMPWTLANTTISVATGAKDGGDFAKRAAVGLKVPLFDEGDPRLDYAFSKCLADLDAAGPGPIPTPGAPGPIAKSDDRKAGEAACVAKANKVHWNRSAAALAFTQTYLDTGDDRKSNLTRDSRTAWASYAWGYNMDMNSATGATEGRGAGQFVVQWKGQRRAIDEATAAGASSTTPVRFNGDQGYLRWRFGSDRMNFDLSGSRERRKYDDGRRDNVKVIAAGAEFKLLEYWLLLTFGREQSDVTGSRAFMLANFKWGVNRDASLRPQ